MIPSMQDVIERPAKWLRSLLFVPGIKREWMLKAPKYGADGLIFDLEDSVPSDRKADGRSETGRVITELHASGVGGVPSLFVRVNPWGSGDTLADLDAIVQPGLAGVMLPKTREPEEVSALDLVLADLERTRGLAPESIEIYPLAETARGIQQVAEIASSSTRIKRMSGAGTLAAKAGDGHRALGLRPRPDQLESLYLSSRKVLGARAAGVGQIYTGIYGQINDLDAVRRACTDALDFGATGSLLIHPTHVAIANEVFSPSPEEIAEAIEVLVAMERAIAEGDAAVRVGSGMVDYAHARSAVDLLDRATEVGIDVGPYPKQVLA